MASSEEQGREGEFQVEGGCIKAQRQERGATSSSAWGMGGGMPREKGNILENLVEGRSLRALQGMFGHSPEGNR